MIDDVQVWTTHGLVVLAQVSKADCVLMTKAQARAVGKRLVAEADAGEPISVAGEPTIAARITENERRELHTLRGYLDEFESSLLVNHQLTTGARYQSLKGFLDGLILKLDRAESTEVTRG